MISTNEKISVGGWFRHAAQKKTCGKTATPMDATIIIGMVTAWQ